MMAQTIVITPTHIAKATLIFSIREIRRFHRRRTGIAITMCLVSCRTLDMISCAEHLNSTNVEIMERQKGGTNLVNQSIDPLQGRSKGWLPQPLHLGN